MEIVDLADFITDRDKVYEFKGVYYHRCWECDCIHEVDWHKTKHDIKRAQPGEEESFCDKNCERAYYYDGGE